MSLHYSETHTQLLIKGMMPLTDRDRQWLNLVPRMEEWARSNNEDQPISYMRGQNPMKALADSYTKQWMDREQQTERRSHCARR